MHIACSRSRLVFLFGFALCLMADFILARHLLPNSDSVQSYREMLAVRSGNVLLHHWVLATDDFILTDLVPMLAASLVLGPGTRLIYVVPFIVFASMLATSIQIVRTCTRTHEGRLAGSYAVLLLFGIPYGLLYNFFFWSDFHVATITMSLIAVLTVAPALSGEPFGRWRLLPFTGLVFAAAFSDPLADILLAAPVVLLVMLRAWLTGVLRIDECLVAGCAAAGAVCGIAALRLLVWSGTSFRPAAQRVAGFRSRRRRRRPGSSRDRGGRTGPVHRPGASHRHAAAPPADRRFAAPGGHSASPRPAARCCGACHDRDGPGRRSCWWRVRCA